MDANTTGANNTAVGTSALGANIDSDNNVAVGTNALILNTTGSENTAVGMQALKANTTAEDNVAIGFNSLSANQGTGDNTAVGARSLEANTAAGNTAVGSRAMEANTSGVRNMAIGMNAYNSSDTENDNIAIGFDAMTINTAGGNNNVAVGNYSLDELTAGDNNVAVGHSAGHSITAGEANVAIGMSAYAEMTTGGAGVAVGHLALADCTTANYNIGIGYRAGNHGNPPTTGAQNILIGAYGGLSASNGSEQIVMGYDVDGPANSTFTFGSGGTDTSCVFGETSLSAPSDIRLKENISDATAGLSFINGLRPVNFRWKKEKDVPTEFKSYVAGSEARVMNEYENNHGFIAQEVKVAMDADPSIKDGFGMWKLDGTGRQRVADAALTPIFVKAIQELTTKIEVLEQEAGYHLDTIILDGTNGSSANAGGNILLG